MRVAVLVLGNGLAAVVPLTVRPDVQERECFAAVIAAVEPHAKGTDFRLQLFRRSGEVGVQFSTQTPAGADWDPNAFTDAIIAAVEADPMIGHGGDCHLRLERSEGVMEWAHLCSLGQGAPSGRPLN